MIESVTAVIDSLALVALVATLAVVWRQARAIGRQTDALIESVAINASATLDAAFGAVSAVFISHPEIRPLFYPDEGASPDLNMDSTRIRANAVAEMLCDIFDGWFRLRSDSHIWDEVGSWYEAYMNDALRQSAFLRGYLLRRGRWYDQALVALAATQEAEVSSESDLP